YMRGIDGDQIQSGRVSIRRPRTKSGLRTGSDMTTRSQSTQPPQDAGDSPGGTILNDCCAQSIRQLQPPTAYDRIYRAQFALVTFSIKYAAPRACGTATKSVCSGLYSEGSRSGQLSKIAVSLCRSIIDATSTFSASRFTFSMM